MAVQLRPGHSSLLMAGTYSFTFEEVCLIYKLYTENKLTIWELKELGFKEAHIREIAVAIVHGKMDMEHLPYDQRPTFIYDPDSIQLQEFRVDKPSQ